MGAKQADLLVRLIETVRELSFDVNFCLEILKQDEDIAKFYEKCKKRFEEQREKVEMEAE